MENRPYPMRGEVVDIPIGASLATSVHAPSLLTVLDDLSVGNWLSVSVKAKEKSLKAH